MGPFQFETYHNPYVQSISQLMLAPAQAQAQAATTIGEAQARAAQQQGQAWSGALNNIAQTVAQLPQQFVGMKQAAARQALEQEQAKSIAMKNAAESHLQSGQNAVAAALSPHTLAPGQEGPQAPSFMKDGPLGSKLWDLDALSEHFNSGGYGDITPVLLEGAKEQNQRVATTLQSRQNTRATTAATVIQLMDKGVPFESAYQTGSQLLLANGLETKDEVQQFGQQIGALGDPAAQRAALLNVVKSSSEKPEILKEGDIQMLHGVQIGGGAPKPQKFQAKSVLLDGVPQEVSFDEGSGKYVFNGEDVTGRVQPVPANVTPKSIESKPVLLDGRPSLVNFNPSTGKHTLPNGTDVSNRVTPIPAASITIRNEQNAGIQLPAWATDDSRPSGPEANTLDQKTKMTPNGLYQAALNYIANGQYPTTGRGSDPVAVAQRAAVTSKVGAIAAASGMDEPALRAFYKANGASLAAQQKMQDSVQGFIATADKNAALLDDSLKKIPDTGSPLFNKPLRSFQKDVLGNTDLSQFGTYLQSVQNEYARIISQPNLAGQLTDSARKEAETLLDPKSTVPQMLASLQALKNEGNNRLMSVGEQIQRIQQRIQAGPQGNNPPSSTAPIERWERVNGVMKKVGG